MLNLWHRGFRHESWTIYIHPILVFFSLEILRQHQQPPSEKVHRKWLENSSTEFSNCQVFDPQDLSKATAGAHQWWKIVMKRSLVSFSHKLWKQQILFVDICTDTCGYDNRMHLFFQVGKKRCIELNILTLAKPKLLNSINYKSSFMWLISIPTHHFLLSSINAESFRCLGRFLLVEIFQRYLGPKVRFRRGFRCCHGWSRKALENCEWQKMGKRISKIKNTPWKIHMQPKRSPHQEKEKSSSKPPLLCSMLIFQGEIQQPGLEQSHKNRDK